MKGKPFESEEVTLDDMDNTERLLIRCRFRPPGLIAEFLDKMGSTIVRDIDGLLAEWDTARRQNLEFKAGSLVVHYQDYVRGKSRKYPGWVREVTVLRLEQDRLARAERDAVLDDSEPI